MQSDLSRNGHAKGLHAMQRGTQSPLISRPEWLAGFQSDDLDEVRFYNARWDGEHSRIAHGAGPLGFESAVLVGDLCSVAWGSARLPVTVRGALACPVLHLGPAASRYRLGRREHVMGPQDAMFVAPGCEFTRRGEAGTILAIAPDRGRLLEEVAVRGGNGPGRPQLATQRLAIDQDARPRLATALEMLVRGRAPGADPTLAQRAEAGLVAVVADLLVRDSAVVRTRESTRIQIADLEDWIEANLERPITADQLRRIAGMSPRGLEKLFETRHGMSPMRFVVERRLAAAHRLLLSPGRGDDVTTIAASVGFSHMGRFACAYRQCFGESPSSTLRRAKNRPIRIVAG